MVVRVQKSLSLVLVSVLTLSTLGLAASGSEPDGGTAVGPLPAQLVTGHTIFLRAELADTPGEGRDGPVIPRMDASGGTADHFPDNISVAHQSECVVWFNGKNLDVRPAGTFYFADATGSAGDGAHQDYLGGHLVEDCMPWMLNTSVYHPDERLSLGFPTDFAAVVGHASGLTVSDGGFAVVVERDDCDPRHGRDFRYRGHLDFVDPNGIYHEVQEYDYVCGNPLSGTPVGGVLPDAASPSGLMADAVKMLFPYTWTDPDNGAGCQTWATPANNTDPANGQTGFFDHGHKCNGSIQDLFTERMWITQVHQTVMDPSLDRAYNYALVADTCTGVNIYEGIPVPGLAGPGRPDGESDDARDPGEGKDPVVGMVQTNPVRYMDQIDYFLDGLGLGLPLVEVCHDGSSFSFNDTPRGRILHERPPTPGDLDMIDGNAYDYDRDSSTFGMHRNNCRSNWVYHWAYNEYPGRNSGENFLGLTSNGPLNTIGDDCYREDHKTAQIDVYILDVDPTGGLFALHTNHLTGPNAYTHAPITGPNWLPGDPAPVQEW